MLIVWFLKAICCIKAILRADIQIVRPFCIKCKVKLNILVDEVLQIPFGIFGQAYKGVPKRYIHKSVFLKKQDALK